MFGTERRDHQERRGCVGLSSINSRCPPAGIIFKSRGHALGKQITLAIVRTISGLLTVREGWRGGVVIFLDWQRSAII